MPARRTRRRYVRRRRGRAVSRRRVTRRRRVRSRRLGGRRRIQPTRQNRAYHRFPEQLRVKLKFSQLQNYDIPAGGTATFTTWRLNGAKDPDYGAGTGTPIGWATYSALYTNYSVIGVSYKFELLASQATVPEDFATMFAKVADINTIPTSSLGLQRMENCQRKLLLMDSTARIKPTTISGYVKIGDWHNQTPFARSVSTSTSPSDVLFLMTGLYCPNAADLSSCNARVILMYDVQFTGLIPDTDGL